MGSKKKQVAGHRWFWGQHLVLCHGPVDAVRRIWFGEKVGWSGSVLSNSRIHIDQPTLFGDRDQYGGIVGDIDICLGHASQIVNNYLAHHCGQVVNGQKVVSAFRHLTALVFRKPEMGNSSYPAPVAVEVERISTGWDGNEIWYVTKAAIGNGLNGAHIVHELIECPEWGTGNSNIDNKAFEACANTLYAEGFGLNAHWVKQQPVEQFVKDICRYLNGYVFTDEASGLITMRLARDNYDTSKVPALTSKVIKTAKNIRRRTQADIINTLTLTYTDPTTYEKSAVTVINSAMVHAVGRTIGETVNFPMIHDAQLAYRVAMRELKMLSARLMTTELYCDTTASVYQPGDVVRVVYPPAGFNHIMRVQKKRRGSMAQPEVKLELMEDIFSAATGDYIPPPPSGWKDPITTPVPITIQQVVESPYWLLATSLNPSELAALNKHSCFVGWLARKPSGDTIGADLYYNNFDRWIYSHRASFSTSSMLAESISPMATQLRLIDSNLLTIELPAVCQLGGELVVVKSIVDGVAEVERGVLDTIPAEHAAMIVIAALDGDALDTEFTTGEQVSVRGLTVTARGALPKDDAAIITTELVGRAAKPLCVTNVKLNDEHWPDTITIPVNVTWSHRNRISQVVEPQHLTNWYTGGTPEPDTTTQISVMDADTNAVLYQGETTETELLLDETLIPALTQRLTITLTATREGNEAMQPFSHTFNVVFTPKAEVFKNSDI
ncbi:phage tail protein [Photobacterium sanguinicancri]|uniref:Phage tail protein n=1 Tax=Photobacterium sanguinicancri TaxID=875932 RepID=A0AAW7Y2K4_9GAMM|nr:phage tail protein [Photobacterium sanguinicancri]MDO6542828.1 phage tail protein [Photobacterium sanguinicancri]